MNDEETERHRKWMALCASVRPIVERYREGGHVALRRERTLRSPDKLSCPICGNQIGSDPCKQWKGAAA